MGIIRTLLALAVVFSHTHGFVFVGGKLAVQLFYMISGFLISYVLVEKKAYPRVHYFYFNRFLRLYPIYWLVALLTLAMYSFAEVFGRQTDFFSVYRNLGWGADFLLVLVNGAILGQDWVMFTGVRDGAFQFVSNFRDTEINVWNGLLVPQAWTLGLELSFYLIAPFLLKNKAYLFLVFVFSVLIKILLAVLNLGGVDPWSYRFFPAELSFFLAGSISHQFLKPLCEKFFSSRISMVSNLVTLIVFLFCAIFFILPSRDVFEWIIVFIFFLALPLLFIFQIDKPWDGVVGDLSYPVYISHMLLIPPVSMVVNKLFQGGSLVISFGVVVLTLIFSYIINRYIASRVERLRSSFKGV